jgi:hypothetical protein
VSHLTAQALAKVMKKPSSTLFFAVIALAINVVTDPVFAGGRKKATPAPEYHPPVISSVTGNSITVTGEKTTRTFIVTQFTEINVNGQRGTIADLKPGMAVSVTIGVDPTRAGRIVATGAPEDGKQKKK